MAQSLDNKSFATFDAPRRNRFYYGKLLDVFHLEMEQDYGRLMRALSNRLTAGAGLLCGLGISIDGDRVCIDRGVAIDRLGREIISPTTHALIPGVMIRLAPAARHLRRAPAMWRTLSRSSFATANAGWIGDRR